MKSIIYFLANYLDADIDWLNANGKRDYIKNREILIEQGQMPDKFYLILDGQAEVIYDKKRSIAVLGVGETLGEMSFVDERPPAATVIAKGDLMVLAVDRLILSKKLDADGSFSSRFYRSLSMILSDRLRKMTNDRGQDDKLFNEGWQWQSETNPELLREMALNGQRFVQMLKDRPSND